jgi:anti-sigma B factor antagonist
VYRTASGRLPGACHPLPEGIPCDYGQFLSWIKRQSHPGRHGVVAEGVIALSITNKRADGVIVVHLSGAIFFDEESTSLRVRVKYLLDKSPQIVLDLGNVTRIDSCGLGTLVALYASARRIGGDIKLANLGNHIREALQITRLVTVFEVFDNVEDAIASFNKAATAS